MKRVLKSISERRGVGAAADGDGLGCPVAGELPVHVHEGADQLGLGGDVVAQGVGPLLDGKAQGAHALVDGPCELLEGHGGGVADVEADGDASFVSGEDGRGQRQAAGGVGEVHAQPLAVVVAAEELDQPGEGLPIRRGQVRFAEGLQELRKGVIRVVRHGGVALLALGGDGGDYGRRFTGDHVRGGAHLGPDGAGILLFEEHVGDVHLGIDHGVSGVGGEGHGGLPLHLPVPLHARGAPLLVAAQEDADPALHLGAALLQGVEGVEGGHCRTLVVRRAPAVHSPVVDLGAVGGIGPARALGDHVQMGHHGHQLVAFPVLHHAAAGFHVPHLFKAQLLGDFLSLPQGVEHVFAVGHPLLGLAPGHGGYADQFLQVLHLVLKALFNDVVHNHPPSISFFFSVPQVSKKMKP